MSEYNEFERFIRHQEFGKILDLAGRLKDQRSRLVSFASPDNNAGDAPSSSSLMTPIRKSSRVENAHEHSDLHLSHGGHHQNADRDDLVGTRPSSRRGGTRDSYCTPSSIESAADMIRSAMIPSFDTGAFATDGAESSQPRTVQRGAFPITDSLVDETITSLAQELRYCLELKKQLSEAATDSRIISPSNTETGSPTAPRYSERYSKWQIDTLQEWLLEHRLHPYPSQNEVTQLARASGLDPNEVASWISTARRRHMKLVVERQRKPRDFVDFMFLATDRENQIMSDHPGKYLSFQHDQTSYHVLPTGSRHKPLPYQSVAPSRSRQTLGRSKKSRQRMAVETPRYSYPPPTQTEPISLPTPPGKSAPEWLHSPSTSYNKYQYRPQAPSNENTYARPYKQMTPRNAEQIFRRGKQFHQLPAHNERDHETEISHLDHLEPPELPQRSWSFSGKHDSDPEQEGKLRDNERRLIEKYTPRGVIETPEGSLDGSFDVGDFDETLFDKYYLHPLTYEGVDIASLEIGNDAKERPRDLYRCDSFNVDDALGVPDENERDLLNMIA